MEWWVCGNVFPQNLPKSSVKKERKQMKVSLSVSRIASLLAVALVASLNFGCAIGHPTFAWKSPEPAKKEPLVPPGYKLVPDTTPGVTAPAPAGVVLNPAVITQSLAPTNGPAIIRAPGLLTEDVPVPSGNPTFKVRFVNPFDFPVTIHVNHGLRQVEVPKKGFKDIQLDSGSQVTPYEAYYGKQVIHAGTVKTTTGAPFTTEVILFTLKTTP
ncbi:MAG: hypothetical protein RLZZ347_565 [Candidatus Parcubacteria bacterium]|jgi:hypothetical protein